MDAATIDTRLCAACTATGAACCKSGHVFLTLEEHARLEEHCAEAREASFGEAFHRRITMDTDFALLDQGDGCLFLDADNGCTLHAIGLKPQECHWWPLHVYRQADDTGERMSVCLSDYCCDGIRNVAEAQAFLPRYLARMIERLPALRRFRSIFPGSTPRRLVCKIGGGEAGGEA